MVPSGNNGETPYQFLAPFHSLLGPLIPPQPATQNTQNDQRQSPKPPEGPANWAGSLPSIQEMLAHKSEGKQPEKEEEQPARTTKRKRTPDSNRDSPMRDSSAAFQQSLFAPQPIWPSRNFGYSQPQPPLPPAQVTFVDDKPPQAQVTFVDDKPPQPKLTRRRVPKKPRTHVVKHTDGFGWLKYGQKIVKRSNCHRSYYRCSEAGCSAKKTVEQELVPTDGVKSKVWCTTAGEHNHGRVCNALAGPGPNPGAIIVSVQDKHKYRVEEGYSDAQSHRGMLAQVIEEDSDNVSATSAEEEQQQL